MNLYNFDGDQWFKIYKCLTNKARGAYTYNYDWVLSTHEAIAIDSSYMSYKEDTWRH